MRRCHSDRYNGTFQIKILRIMFRKEGKETPLSNASQVLCVLLIQYKKFIINISNVAKVSCNSKRHNKL
jgi:hypothetical protein